MNASSASGNLLSLGRRLNGWCHVVLVGVLMSLVVPTAQSQVTPTGSLANFDVRYPPSLPNDLDIFLYGDGLKCEDVIWTWNTDILLGGAGLQWGHPSCSGPEVNTDPSSPGFGLDCIRIRYAGPSRPAMVGRMVHGGIHLRPGVQVEHQEIWWTLNGERLLRPCDPQIRWVWHRTTRTWIVCITNPTPDPIYFYGFRWFLPFPNTTAEVPLPTLNDLTTDLRPEAFNAEWQPAPALVPGVPFPRIICVPPWCRFYIRIQVPIVVCRPIIFQLAAANSDFGGEPPEVSNPDDERTMMIMTARATQEFDADVDRDGVVGARDRNLMRSEFLMESVDLVPPEGNPTGDNQN